MREGWAVGLTIHAQLNSILDTRNCRCQSGDLSASRAQTRYVASQPSAAREGTNATGGRRALITLIIDGSAAKSRDFIVPCPSLYRPTTPSHSNDVTARAPHVVGSRDLSTTLQRRAGATLQFRFLDAIRAQCDVAPSNCSVCLGLEIDCTGFTGLTNLYSYTRAHQIATI